MQFTGDSGQTWTVRGPPRAGGQADVYPAVGPDDEQVAVKVARDAAFMSERLGMELVQMRGLLSRHPELSEVVISVRDAGQDEQGRAFLVMPWVDQDLDAWLQGRGLVDRLRAAAAVGEAITRFHRSSLDWRKGVVHRDIKPKNLLVAADDGPRLLLADFGGAKRASGASTVGSGFHTAGYAPPDQALPRKGDPDRSWDVYALGVTVFECLVGRVPLGARVATYAYTPDGHQLLALVDQRSRGSFAPGDEHRLDTLAQKRVAELIDLARIEPLMEADRAALREVLSDTPSSVLELEDALDDALAPDPARRQSDARPLVRAVEGALRRVRRVRRRSASSAPAPAPAASPAARMPGTVDRRAAAAPRPAVPGTVNRKAVAARRGSAPPSPAARAASRSPSPPPAARRPTSAEPRRQARPSQRHDAARPSHPTPRPAAPPASDRPERPRARPPLRQRAPQASAAPATRAEGPFGSESAAGREQRAAAPPVADLSGDPTTPIPRVGHIPLSARMDSLPGPQRRTAPSPEPPAAAPAQDAAAGSPAERPPEAPRVGHTPLSARMASLPRAGAFPRTQPTPIPSEAPQSTAAAAPPAARPSEAQRLGHLPLSARMASLPRPEASARTRPIAQEEPLDGLSWLRQACGQTPRLYALPHRGALQAFSAAAGKAFIGYHGERPLLFVDTSRLANMGAGVLVTDATVVWSEGRKMRQRTLAAEDREADAQPAQGWLSSGTAVAMGQDRAPIRNTHDDLACAMLVARLVRQLAIERFGA